MKKYIKKILAVCAVVVLLSLSIIPCFAEEVGFRFATEQLISVGLGLDAQKTLAKDTHDILCITIWDEYGDDQFQYFVYFTSTGNNIDIVNSSAFTETGGEIIMNNPSAPIYRAEYNTTASGGYVNKKFVSSAECTLRVNEIILAYKDNGWKVNRSPAADYYISSVNVEPSARMAYKSYIQALMGFNGTYENSITQNYEEGYANGYKKGQSDGYNTGCDEAYTYYNRVITSRENQAYDRGYTIGYSVGFKEGVGGDVKAYELRIDKIITAVPEAIRILIDESLDGLKVGGIALGSFAIGILVLGLIVTVVLWLWKVFK